MSVVAPAPIARDDDPGPPVVPDLRSEVFLDGLATRLHEEYGTDRQDLRTAAVAALAEFASAPVQAFVQILVEKRVREACRGRPAAQPRGERGVRGPRRGGPAARPGGRPRRAAPAGEGVPMPPVPPGVRALRGY